ncbi:C1 family peptidase [uncultured Lacinutrix sp.]|uniref:C1 family peptidase n=1 Tax=uncultured Lacinutrix sp. TaxID=574032 RepID=UPI002633AF89|nr:C1 family peptidase [uncultured Lacinutrix sp.]
MKNTKLLILLVLLLFSCGTDYDDNIKSENPEIETTLDTTLEANNTISINGTDYYTGAICIGNGDYFNTNNEIENLVIPENLPENYDLSYLLPPIGDQGSQGSCVSWAVTYYMKSLQEKIETNLPYTDSTIMSPSYTYNQITQGNCIGTNIGETLNILKEKGACSINDFPYFDTTCAIQPTEIEHDKASNAKISDFKSLSGIDMVLEMKTLLTQLTPIIISTYLSSEFAKIDNFGITAYREHIVDYSLDRCHAMLVVGYSDEYEAFKVVNSWGENFGDDGFVWIDYKAFHNVIDESAAFRVINLAYVAYDL